MSTKVVLLVLLSAIVDDLGLASAHVIPTLKKTVAVPSPVLLTQAISTQYHAQDELGQYTFGYAGGPSAKHETKTVDGVTRGGYSYVDANGLVQSTAYVSDPINGFRVAATNLPAGPAVVPAKSVVVTNPIQQIVVSKSVVAAVPASPTIISTPPLVVATAAATDEQQLNSTEDSDAVQLDKDKQQSSEESTTSSTTDLISEELVATTILPSDDKIEEQPTPIVTADDNNDNDLTQKSDVEISSTSEPDSVQVTEDKTAEDQNKDLPTSVQLSDNPASLNTIITGKTATLLNVAPIPVVSGPAVAVAPALGVNPIITAQYHAQDELGQYTFGYSGGPSAKHETKTVDGVTRGGYSYIDAHGQVQSAVYVSDKINGFRVAATNIPVQPEPKYIPDSEPVAKAKEKLFKLQAEHIAKL